MNFYIIRVLILLPIAILFIFLYKKWNLPKKKKILIFAISIFLIVSIITGTSFENTFYKLSTLEKAFHYRYSNGTIIDTSKNGDYVLVTYSTSEEKFCYTYFIKEKNKYLLPEPNFQNQHYRYYYGRAIQAQMINKNTAIVSVEYDFIYNPYSEDYENIQDTSQNEFHRIVVTNFGTRLIYYTLVTNYNSDYTISINGENIKP